MGCFGMFNMFLDAFSLNGRSLERWEGLLRAESFFRSGLFMRWFDRLIFLFMCRLLDCELEITTYTDHWMEYHRKNHSWGVVSVASRQSLQIVEAFNMDYTSENTQLCAIPQKVPGSPKHPGEAEERKALLV